MTGQIRTIWTLAALGIAWGALLCAYQGVMLESDDVLYARLASDLAEGHPTFAINPHTYRLGYIVPLAALYQAFGIHEWTTVAFPLLCGLLTVLLAAYAADRLYGRRAALVAALLCGFNPILYRSASVGMPDVPAGFLYGVFIVGWLLVVADRAGCARTWALLSGLACAWAVATRESTAPMVLVTLAGFLTVGWRGGKLREFPFREWLSGCCLIGIPYLSYLWWHTGTPFYMLKAAQGGFAFAGVPWLNQLEGFPLAARLTGLTILRASLEGYLFAVLPVLLASAIGGLPGGDGPSDLIRRHLLVAILSPLLILSHFSTTLSQWAPIHLDLRFGSPLVVPAGILAAAASLRLPEVPLAKAARIGVGLVLLAAIGLVGVSWTRDNHWSLIGGLAAVAACLALLLAKRLPKAVLPALTVALLMANWGWHFTHVFTEEAARNRMVRHDAEAVPWDPALPILTNPLAVRMLLYLHRFADAPLVATWKGTGEIGRPFYWEVRLDGPWAGPYLLVWHRGEAAVQTQRWYGQVPPWVFQELARGRLIRPFLDESTFVPAFPSFDRPRTLSDEYRTWPQSGIYLIEARHEG